MGFESCACAAVGSVVEHGVQDGTGNEWLDGDGSYLCFLLSLGMYVNIFDFCLHFFAEIFYEKWKVFVTVALKIKSRQFLSALQYIQHCVSMFFTCLSSVCFDFGNTES